MYFWHFWEVLSNTQDILSYIETVLSNRDDVLSLLEDILSYSIYSVNYDRTSRLFDRNSNIYDRISSNADRTSLGMTENHSLTEPQERYFFCQTSSNFEYAVIYICFIIFKYNVWTKKHWTVNKFVELVHVKESRLIKIYLIIVEFKEVCVK